MLAAPVAFGDMVANWNFNDGTANDGVLVGGQQNGTMIGGVAIVNDEERGLVASFDGKLGSRIDCGVQLPKIYNTTAAYSVSAWVYTVPKVAGSTENADQWPEIAGTGWPFANLMCTPGGGVGITFAINLSTNNVAAEMPVGEWVHLASTYDGATLKLYVNGILAVSAAETGAVWGTGGDGVTHFGIGGMYNNGGPYNPTQEFKGMMDDVRWYNSAMDLAGVRASMIEVPEPITIALLGLGSLLLRRRNA